jgi:hypothetical protein
LVAGTASIRYAPACDDDESDIDFTRSAELPFFFSVVSTAKAAVHGVAGSPCSL